MPLANESPAERQVPQQSPNFPVLLTLLIVNLAKASNAYEPPSAQRAQDDDGSNKTYPITSLPESLRPTLLTLHLLYPHILLDALDLLDRACVIKLHVSKEPPESNKSEIGPRSITAVQRSHAITADLTPPETASLTQQRHDIVSEMARVDAVGVLAGEDEEPLGTQPFPHLDNARASSSSASDPKLIAYYVCSSQRPSNRHASTQSASESPYAQSKGYSVQLGAWNCSCPAFAYTVFADDGRASEEARMRIVSVMDDGAGQSQGGMSSCAGVPNHVVSALPSALQYGFGGFDAFKAPVAERDEERDTVSLEVKKGRNWKLPACCKHLLACVLAEALPKIFSVSIEPASTNAVTDTSRQSESCTRGVVQRWISLEEAAGWAVGAGFGF